MLVARNVISCTQYLCRELVLNKGPFKLPVCKCGLFPKVMTKQVVCVKKPMYLKKYTHT